METFDTPELWDIWKEEEADEPAAPSKEVLAPGGGAWTAEVQRPGRSITDIYRRYQRLVWKKLRKAGIAPESAAEIHQDVFLVLDRLMHKKDPIESVPAMLSAITWRMISTHLRDLEHRPPIDAGVEADELPASQPDVEQRMDTADRKRIVEVILAKLPREEAQLIQWLDLAEMTHEQVAGILQRPIGTVKTQHRRAREKFRQLGERLYKKADLGGDS